MPISKDLVEQIHKVYSPRDANYVVKQLKLLPKSQNSRTLRKTTNKDIALITYADSVIEKNNYSLNSLSKFIKLNNLQKHINITHVLPFYPWDTDRGFSVINYQKVNEVYGNWSDIAKLTKIQDLMFDFVANHISIDNPIAQESLIARHVDIKTNYRNFVIAYSETDKPSDIKLKKLARPRPNPVLTPYYVTKIDNQYKALLGKPNQNTKVYGNGLVWTTFSRAKDKNGNEETKQVDLNFKNPAVLIEAINILLFYVRKGAKLIRLDAIGYIWKKLGSSSLHEKEAHILLNIINTTLKECNPTVITIAEINEPQDKVITYLGTSKKPESDMVYQFTHFPLSIYSLMKRDVSIYQKWYQSTKEFYGKQFITVTGSHDGLGLKPVRNILSEDQIAEFENYLIKKHNALPNYAILPGGKKIVYEICATPWNLVNSPKSNESEDIQTQKYLVVVALGLLVKGIPGIYINGLIGSSNYSPKNGLDENRTINRESFDLKKIQKILTGKNIQNKTLNSILNLLEARSKHSAFDPNSPFPKVLDFKNKSVFALLLYGKTKKEQILSIINVSNKAQSVNMTKELLSKSAIDILTTKKVMLDHNLKLSPYQILWLDLAF